MIHNNHQSKDAQEYRGHRTCRGSKSSQAAKNRPRRSAKLGFGQATRTERETQSIGREEGERGSRNGSTRNGKGSCRYGNSAIEVGIDSMLTSTNNKAR